MVWATETVSVARMYMYVHMYEIQLYLVNEQSRIYRIGVATAHQSQRGGKSRTPLLNFSTLQRYVSYLKSKIGAMQVLPPWALERRPYISILYSVPYTHLSTALRLAWPT